MPNLSSFPSVLRLGAMFLLLFFVLCTGTAQAMDLCKAAVLVDVPSFGSPSSIVFRKGETMDAITQYNVEKATGETSFCAHGGSCCPTHVTLNGKKVEALKLLNCTIGSVAWEDEDTISRSVNVDRENNSAADLRRYDLENKLLEMGLCTACADNVATYFMTKPDSHCARLARKALQGNTNAVQQLVAFPDDCKWNY